MLQQEGELLPVGKNGQAGRNNRRGGDAARTGEIMTVQGRLQGCVGCRSDCWTCQEETMTPH